MSSSDRPLILLSNDDGIDADGLRALAGAVHDLGDLVIVAPASEQSSVSRAITDCHPVRTEEVAYEVTNRRIRAWAVSGTPADCIKLACSQILERTPSLVLSGINRGPNTAVNTIYSGTVSAAVEGCVQGVDAAAFSLCTWDVSTYEAAAKAARGIVRRIMEHGLPPRVLLNVNIPDLPLSEINGTRVARLARSRWVGGHAARTDPSGETYYWLSGEFQNLDEGGETDLAATDEGFVSIAPLTIDMTAHESIATIEGWDWSLPTRDG